MNCIYCRWALIKDEQVYKKAIYYMKLNTMGVSRDTQLRMLKIIKVILAEHGRKGDIFSFGYQTMRERWTKLNKVVSKSKRFSLQTIPSQYCNYFKTIRDPSPGNNHIYICNIMHIIYIYIIEMHI